MEPRPGGSASGSLPFLSSPSKAGERPSMAARFPHVGEAEFAGGQQHPRAPGKVGSRQSCAAREPPGYSQPHTQTCTNQLYITQGEIMFEAHFAFLKLQTLEVTCFSFALCFPSHTAWAPSISPAFPQQQMGLETALRRSQGGQSLAYRSHGFPCPATVAP